VIQRAVARAQGLGAGDSAMNEIQRIGNRLFEILAEWHLYLEHRGLVTEG